MTRVLVAYATKHYSTAEIALAIADELEEAPGFSVEVESVENVKSIAPYEIVVLGSAVYMGQWQAGAVEFLKRYEQELAQRAVWLFSSGPTGTGDPQALMNGWKFPENLQGYADQIKPRDITLFHGKLENNWLNLFEKAAVKFIKAPEGDSRDWEMIRSWAKRIAGVPVPV